MSGMYNAPAASQRPVVNSGRLWSGGLATALVAALIAVVGILLARGLFDVPMDNFALARIREALHSGRPLGPEEFVLDMEKRCGRRCWTRKARAASQQRTEQVRNGV